MERFLTLESAFVCLATSFCCAVIFYFYLCELRRKLLEFIASIQQLTETMLTSTATDTLNSETMSQFDNRFNQLAVAPIHAAYRFTGMFSAKQAAYSYTLTILRQVNFPAHVSRMIEQRLEVTKTNLDYVKLTSIISGANHPKEIQNVLVELIHPDTSYQLKKWRAPDSENK